ncbi:hypothetical protein [Desulforhopalus sp. IMCC35007]|uniref:hypothetical protein n=1 Tax=Desulforhopalus sp. IMCC35007 TaxID=2569543 RepID=UPI0010AE77FD|nr:hypothetical protein [Desulforhopalus sp. IMCC35007]TKB07409.1 hypothetical protein FCL48_16835 [Desulforhopalus sp. IMCC35007]
MDQKYIDTTISLVTNLFWNFKDVELLMYNLNREDYTPVQSSLQYPLYGLVADKSSAINNFIKIIKDLEKIGCFILCETIQQARSARKKLDAIAGGCIEMYGVDPDYFFTLVPLCSKNKRNIEKYVLDLKFDHSVKGQLKIFVKKMLALMNYSQALFDGYVVICYVRNDQVN